MIMGHRVGLFEVSKSEILMLSLLTSMYSELM